MFEILQVECQDNSSHRPNPFSNPSLSWKKCPGSLIEGFVVTKKGSFEILQKAQLKKGTRTTVLSNQLVHRKISSANTRKAICLFVLREGVLQKIIYISVDFGADQERDQQSGGGLSLFNLSLIKSHHSSWVPGNLIWWGRPFRFFFCFWSLKSRFEQL